MHSTICDNHKACSPYFCRLITPPFERGPPLFSRWPFGGHPSGGHTRKSQPRRTKSSTMAAGQSWTMPCAPVGDPESESATGDCCYARDHSHAPRPTQCHHQGSRTMSYSRIYARTAAQPTTWPIPAGSTGSSRTTSVHTCLRYTSRLDLMRACTLGPHTASEGSRRQLHRACVRVIAVKWSVQRRRLCGRVRAH